MAMIAQIPAVAAAWNRPGCLHRDAAAIATKAANAYGQRRVSAHRNTINAATREKRVTLWIIRQRA